MREGLEQDDIYMMVEDEFHTVAKTFTHHLHQAEYARYKEQTKRQNAAAVNEITRPVDSMTEMRTETKRKKEAQVKHKRQKEALNDMTARIGRPAGSDEDSELDADKDDDPWVGTDLQFLMTSPQKSKSTLTGLQGVKSSTRAAAGFSQGDSRPSTSHLSLDMSEKSPSKPTKFKSELPVVQDEDATASSEDDDLGAMPVSKTVRPMKALTSSKTVRPSALSSRKSQSNGKPPGWNPFKDFAKPGARAGPTSKDVSSKPIQKESRAAPTGLETSPQKASVSPSKPKRFGKFDSFDDFDDFKPLHIRPTRKPLLKPGKEGRSGSKSGKVKKENSDGKKDHIIPTFII